MALAGCFIREPLSAAEWGWGQRRFHVCVRDVSDRHLPEKQVTGAAVITRASDLPGGAGSLEGDGLGFVRGMERGRTQSLWGGWSSATKFRHRCNTR